MIKFKGIYFTAIAAVIGVVIAAGCGSTAPHRFALVDKEAEKFYPGELKPTFYYTEGVKSMSVYGDDTVAEYFFDRAIALDSTHSPSYYELGNIAYYRKDPARALALSGRAWSLDSTNVWYLAQKGQFSLATGDYAGAQKIYEKLVKDVPHNPENYQRLAALYLYNKLPFSAISVLDSAEYKLGRIEELSAFKRQVLIEVNLIDRAIDETRQMIDEYPYMDENYLILGQLYDATGKDSAALANYGRALKMNPENAATIDAMAGFYKKRGNMTGYLSTLRLMFELPGVPLEEKIRTFGSLTDNREFYGANYSQINALAQTLMTKYPSDYEVVKLYAGHLIASGKIDDALAIYKVHLRDSTLHSSPVVPEGIAEGAENGSADGRKTAGAGKEVADARLDLYNNIIDIESYLERPDSVEKYMDEAIRDFPRNPELYLRSGFSQSFRKHYTKALDNYETALKYARSDSMRSVILGIIGDTYHETGDARRCFHYYDRALKADRDNATVLNNYSYYLSVSGVRLEKALDMASRATQLSPGNPTFIDTYAWTLYKLERYAEAKKAMQQAIALDRSESTELLVHYGDILYELKEYFMASVYWKKAQDKGYDAAEIERRLKSLEGKK